MLFPEYSLALRVYSSHVRAVQKKKNVYNMPPFILRMKINKKIHVHLLICSKKQDDKPKLKRLIGVGRRGLRRGRKKGEMGTGYQVLKKEYVRHFPEYIFLISSDSQNHSQILYTLHISKNRHIIKTNQDKGPQCKMWRKK